MLRHGPQRECTPDEIEAMISFHSGWHGSADVPALFTSQTANGMVVVNRNDRGKKLPGFEDVDINGDGLISRAEWDEWRQGSVRTGFLQTQLQVEPPRRRALPAAGELRPSSSQGQGHSGQPSISHPGHDFMPRHPSKCDARHTYTVGERVRVYPQAAEPYPEKAYGVRPVVTPVQSTRPPRELSVQDLKDLEGWWGSPSAGSRSTSGAGIGFMDKEMRTMLWDRRPGPHPTIY